MDLTQKGRRKPLTLGTVGKQGVMVLVAVFMLFPLLWALLTAFKPKELINTYPPVFFTTDLTLDNFNYAVNSNNIPILLRNTFVYALSATLISIVLASLAAYVLSRYRFRGKGVITMAILCPMLIPGITNLIPLYSIYSKLGWVDTVHGLILLYLPGLLPLPIIILRNYMSSIPIVLEEAGMIDGCNRLQVLYRVVLPILTPGMLAVALINFITVWNDFLITLIFTSTTEMKTITLGLYGILSLGSVHKGIVNATAIISLLPVVVLFLIFRKRFIGSMLEGAVKG